MPREGLGCFLGNPDTVITTRAGAVKCWGRATARVLSMGLGRVLWKMTGTMSRRQRFRMPFMFYLQLPGGTFQ